MSTPTVYKHTDASAPGLPGIMNSYADVFAIFHGCLVAGYGSKTGAGWTLQWQDEPNNKFVLKSGSGFYLRFQKNGYYSSWGAWTIQSFRTMTDIDTGTGAGKVQQFVLSQNQYTGCGAWTILADDKRFYIYVDTAAGLIDHNYKYLWFLGQITPHPSNGSYDGLVNGFFDNFNIKNYSGMGVFSQEQTYRKLNVTQVDKNAAGDQGLFDLHSGANYPYDTGVMRPENTGIVNFSKYELLCENASIGSLPGLIIPATVMSGNSGDIHSVNGKNYMLFMDFQGTNRNGYNVMANALINTEVWDA